MSGRYDYDLDRRGDYRGSWDRDWDSRGGRDWDRGGPVGPTGPRDRRDWSRPPYDGHWDRRDIDRLPVREDWGRDRPVGSWSHGPPPPPPIPLPSDRELYRERDRDWHDRGPVAPPPPLPIDRDVGPPRPLVRKRDSEPYVDRDYIREPGGRYGRGGPDDGDWKRRKVDDDYEAPSNVPYNEGASTWEDRPHHPPHRKEPSEPSQHVIFLGLDPDFTESDLHGFLASKNLPIDSVTIIRDRATGMSRGFGFAQFADVASASSFLLPNFPFIQLPAPASHVKGNGPLPVGRRAKIDFSQSAEKNHEAKTRPLQAPEPAPKPVGRNDGTRDIGSSPNSVILLRSLEKTHTIEDIVDAVRAAEGPNTPGAREMKRVLLIRDKADNSSWGFAFVEMADVESAKALLAGVMNPLYHPQGFRVANKVVAASFMLPYAFQLLPPGSPKESFCIVPSPAVGGVEEGAGWARYWDDNATIEERKFEIAEPEQKPSTDEQTKMEVDTPQKDPEPATEPTSAPPAPTELSATLGPVTLKLTKNEDTKTGKATGVKGLPPKPPNALGFTAGDESPEDSPAKEEASTAANAGEGDKSSAKVAPMVGSSKVAKNITKWNQAKEKEDVAETPAETTPTAETSPTASTPKTLPGDPGFEYGDPVALTCLLCLRQLKSLTQLQRHNNESEMHKNNLRNPSLVKTAVSKVNTARSAILNGQGKKTKGKDGSKDGEGSDSGPKYRDRAQERRRVHNQPDVPIPPTSATKSRFAEGPSPTTPTAPAAPPVEPGKDDSNVGNKMLKKMGWSEGAGLGSEGDGRADPVKTAVYTAGAGIGAAKGKEVTNFSSTSYSDAAKDAARERYES